MLNILLYHLVQHQIFGSTRTPPTSSVSLKEPFCLSGSLPLKEPRLYVSRIFAFLPCDMCLVPCALCHVPCDMCHVTCAMCLVPCAMCLVPCDMCHVPCAMCHVPCDMCRVQCDKEVLRTLCLGLGNEVTYKNLQS